MADVDSWEEIESPASSGEAGAPTVTPTPASSKLNPSAPAFTFNPSAPTFLPRQQVPQQQPQQDPAVGRPVETKPTAQHGGFAVPVRIPIPADSTPAVEASPAPPVGAVDSSASRFEEANGADAVKVTPSKEQKKNDTNASPDKDQIAGKLSAVKLNDGQANAEDREPEMKDNKVIDDRNHLNVVFIGHVDAGKSTIGGQILFLSDMVDERTIQKYEREAKEKNRESWYMAYIMDTNEEERAKGKTVEVGRASFETSKTRFTILDAPGHKNYVPNMISGASQADIGVLVISARKGEFETGFERGGQTREHAQLAKTLGVSKLLVVVNKMDDPSVQWSKERFDEVEKKMTPFLKSCGYNTKKDVVFLPISGLYGTNMKERMSKQTCSWWDGPCLFEALDAIEPPSRDPGGPYRMPIIDRFKDMGTVVMGKVESGSVRRGDNLVIMPNKAQVKVVTIYRDADEVDFAKPGENLRIRLSGVEEEDISSGFVLSSISNPVPSVLEFDAQLQILELLDHKAIFTPGYKAVLHIHSVMEECEVMELMQQIDPKTKKPMKKKVLFVKSGAVVLARVQVNAPICVEKFQECPQMGRFTLRDEGKTVAIGKVMNFKQE